MRQIVRMAEVLKPAPLEDAAKRIRQMAACSPEDQDRVGRNMRKFLKDHLEREVASLGSDFPSRIFLKELSNGETAYLQLDNGSQRILVHPEENGDHSVPRSPTNKEMIELAPIAVESFQKKTLNK